MALTYGFYNALDNDRVYDAVQMSSIFDGVITDGIFPSIGTHFVIRPSSGMDIVVGIGRAWFNHTWTDNDSEFVLSVSISEVLLNRIDAVVLEVNSTDSVRANSIKVVKGTPGTIPVNPTLINTSLVHQYPLAYIYVGAGVSGLIQENFTNKVGTVDCPWVTSVVSDSVLDLPGAAGNVLTSNGSAWRSAAPVVGVAPGTTGNILTSNGSAWISSPPAPAVDYDKLHAEIA